MGEKIEFQSEEDTQKARIEDQSLGNDLVGIDELLSMHELFLALKKKVGKSTLYAMARERKIPSCQIGKGGLRFILPEVLHAIRRPAMSTKPQLEPYQQHRNGVDMQKVCEDDD